MALQLIRYVSGMKSAEGKISKMLQVFDLSAEGDFLNNSSFYFILRLFKFCLICLNVNTDVLLFFPTFKKF